MRTDGTTTRTRTIARSLVVISFAPLKAHARMAVQSPNVNRGDGPYLVQKARESCRDRCAAACTDVASAIARRRSVLDRYASRHGNLWLVHRPRRWLIRPVDEFRKDGRKAVS